MTQRDSDSHRPSHVDAGGRAVMVDVGSKPPTQRRAVAEGRLNMKTATADLLFDQSDTSATPKGSGREIICVARTAGMLAAKQCGNLIPMCHPLPISGVEIDIDRDGDSALVTAAVTITAPTGVEMEALTAVSVTALTLYDMLKAIDKTMEIGGVRVTSKTGGKSDFSA